ncbi:MAG: hypothetical protein JWO25_3332 [Alphaproteobacteria bacterium]|nr:hypothetical protein [Alphaproteobacteria bacterium]
MSRDEDIAASLPDPPPPAPARREATIEAALRRFDEGGEAARSPAARPAPRSPPWWSRLSRSQFGILASAMLVVLVAVPAAWLSLGQNPAMRQPAAPASHVGRPSLSATPPSQPGSAASSEPEFAASNSAAVAEDVAPASAIVAPPPPAEVPSTAEPAVAPEPSSQAPAPPPPPPPAAVAEMVEDSRDRLDGRSANKASSAGAMAQIQNAPLTESAAGESDRSIVVTGARSTRRSVERGDWNACTVDDPRPDPASCRRQIAAGVTGADKRASAFVAEGLNLAWRRDYDGAVAAFDRAIELAPLSSFAYLNRGLALRRNGELNRAIADLDRAVRYGQASARAYYNRGVALRERGDLKRADADQSHAVGLDPSYIAIAQ